MSELAKTMLLLRKDLRGVYRDRLLLVLCIYPLVLAGLVRLAIPYVPIDQIGTILAPFAIMSGGTLLGTVVGFSLIEERERRTWLLLRVVPLGSGTFFAYLAASTSAIAFTTSLGAAAILALPVASLLELVWMTLLASLSAPLLTLLLASFASNKIEGLAVSKILSASLMLPALVFAVPAHWQWLLWWNPLYWTYLGLLRAFAGPADAAALPLVWPDLPIIWFTVAPLAIFALGFAALVRLFRRRAS